MSWRRTPEGCTILFNRDEQRTRSPARPPSVQENPDSGTRFLAPRDPDGGGTWIFVNEHGVIACLLNHYQVPVRPHADRPSRGQLMNRLTRCTGMEDLETNLRRELDEAPYAACFVLAIGPDMPVTMWEWDTRSPRRMPVPALPLHSTSSVDPERILPVRRKTYASIVKNPLQPTAEELERFHAQHDPADPAASVRMERGDARTVSLTRIDLKAGRARMNYRPVDNGEHHEELTFEALYRL